MEISYRWLREFIDLDASPDLLAEKLTMAGVPAEEINEPGKEISDVLAGKICSLEKHPDADRLLVCCIDIGADEKLQIVTGATNVFDGAIVPVAIHGSTLPGGVKIKKGKLRGVESAGMLCSAKELKLDLDLLPASQREGIFILPSDIMPGADVVKVLELDDAVLSLELTPNRGDCFSHLGVARDAAALFGGEIMRPDYALIEGQRNAAQSVSISIETPLCQRYLARVIRGVKVKPSPSWVVNRLRNLGLRSINNVADVTNLVMMGLGQPLHAFDLRQIKGEQIRVRQAMPGEKITTLDGVNRELDTSVMVIADQDKPVAIAGVMGGLDSEVSEQTTDVLLECALFEGINIRKTAQKLALRSEASNRYEKGIDSQLMEYALDYAAALIAELSGGEVEKGVVVAGVGGYAKRHVIFDAVKINQILGTDLSKDQMLKILTSLGFVFDSTINEMDIPSWRGDVSIIEDLAEEVARINGYDNIPVDLPSGKTTSSKWPQHVLVDQLVRSVLLSSGYSEAMTFSFVSQEALDKLRLPEKHELRSCVELKNPVSDDYKLMRTTLVPGLLESVARNISRQVRQVRLFETARVYQNKKGQDEWPYVEKLFLGAALSSDNPGQVVTSGDELFYQAKGIIENICRQLRLPMQVASKEFAFLHPGRSACVTIAGEEVGYVGELHPQVASSFEIKQRVVLLELDLQALAALEFQPRAHRELPRYPMIERDLAFLADCNVRVQEILDLVESSGAANLESVSFFDIYRGKQLADGKQSLAFKFIFRAPDRTLTVEDTDQAISMVVNLLREKLCIDLRG